MAIQQVIVTPTENCDAYKYGASVYTATSYIIIGTEFSGVHYDSIVRFKIPVLPPSKNFISAKLSLVLYDSIAGEYTARAKVYAENAVNASALPLNLTEFNAKQWTTEFYQMAQVMPEAASEQRVEITGLENIINVITNKTSFAADNYIMLFFDDETATSWWPPKIYARSWEKSTAATRPLLILEYDDTPVAIAFNPDTIRNKTIFRLTIADNSAVIPLSNCNIQFRIEMKDANGETLPAWESSSSPFTNGYDATKCKYRLFFNGTVQGLAKIAEITEGLSGFSDLIFEYSAQTVNGVQDWNELAFVRPAMKTATPSCGAQSQSISLYAEKEALVSDYTWDYQEVDISGVSFRSPNQQGGKYTYNIGGLLTGIKPGWKAVYQGESFVVGEIQYIINTSGIQTYLKEY